MSDNVKITISRGGSMSQRYRQSEALLERSCKSVPLGSQTFSKSKQQFPYGAAPFFIKKGKGSRAWDVDDNEYIDFVNGLLAVSLGYQDPDVDAAVQEQMKNGVIFSLPHQLEVQVAEKIIDMVPCAEMVRFGKNGSDATAGAIRLARAYTKRDYVVVCGYHGWQDWYIGSTTRDLGVPEATKALTLKFTYNDLSSLEKLFAQYPDQIAAVIMEPMNIEFPKPGFLQGVKESCHQHGALFILDEMITGFRLANGGAQELFGVTPDLVTLGKGVANGYPLSAVAGRKEIMRLMEDIFFSFTFAGETLSLAAALAVMQKLQREPVLAHIHQLGEKLIIGVKELLHKYELEGVISISGHPAWSILSFKDFAGYSMWQTKTLWMQEILKRGILSVGSHNLSYAHSEADIIRLLQVYDEVFAIIKEAMAAQTLVEQLDGEVLKPLFSVR